MCSTEGKVDSFNKFDERFLRLLREENDSIDCDCEFIVGWNNVVIKGHKFMFSLASAVFKAMFNGNLKEEGVVKIEDLEPEGFEGMKQFIYTGKVNFNSSLHALFVFTAARKYMIPALVEKCKNYIIKAEIHPLEVLEFLEYCKACNISGFDNLCRRIIEGKTNEVVESEYFASAKIETVELILQSPSLHLHSEIEVFKCFEKWALAEVERKGIEAEDMQTKFDHLKKHIRLLTINFQEFVSEVETSLFLTQEEKHAIALNLMVLDPKPMTKSLSPQKMSRIFSLLNERERGDYNKRFGGNSIEGKIIYVSSSTFVEMIFSRILEYICFHIQPLKRVIKNMIYLMTMEAKLEVITKSNENDDRKAEFLLIQEECNIILDFKTNKRNDPMIFAKIPISKLQNIRSQHPKDKVFIEGQFKFSVRKLDDKSSLKQMKKRVRNLQC
ncbi:hypothetical protein LSTR_LSTR003219 [Laodelphax striatellus]|uniref:BTB domain-containing protein n=1 Tax=Laodelphax striatellus TaxID=195883 RepID=A0A482XTP3_LAOST|nr:hypothetical protein LSTR_LSTR003219 [Laodelphax striatellus]